MPSASEPQYKNEMHLAGTLAKDPLIRYTAAGKAVANLTVLTKYEQFSEFHRVTCSERLAEKAAECAKGDFVKIVGRLQTRSWDDKASGHKKYSTDIVAFQFVTGKEQAPTPQARKTHASPLLTPDQTNIHGVAITDNDIPV
jgi:single-strand DNA-binding protein